MRIHVQAVAIVLVCAACSSPEIAAPPPPPAARAAAEWPVASADDGRTRLRLTSAFLTPAAANDVHPRLFVQGRLEGEPDLIIADVPTDALPRARLLVDDDPREIVVRSVAVGRHGLRDVSVEDVDAGAAPRRIRSLAVECRLLRVRKWATFELVLREGDERRSVVQPPFEFVLAPENRWGVWLGAWSTDLSLADDRGVRGVWTAREAVTQAVVRDARGTVLEGGGGTNRTTVFYDRAHPEAPLAYPITATMRVPEEFDVVPATYRFADLDVGR